MTRIPDPSRRSGGYPQGLPTYILLYGLPNHLAGLAHAAVELSAAHNLTHIGQPAGTTIDAEKAFPRRVPPWVPAVTQTQANSRQAALAAACLRSSKTINQKNGGFIPVYPACFPNTAVPSAIGWASRRSQFTANGPEKESTTGAGAAHAGQAGRRFKLCAYDAWVRRGGRRTARPAIARHGAQQVRMAAGCTLREIPALRGRKACSLISRTIYAKAPQEWSTGGRSTVLYTVLPWCVLPITFSVQTRLRPRLRLRIALCAVL